MRRRPLKLSMHCTCGDSLSGTITDLELADKILQDFSNQHCGPGHLPCAPPGHKAEYRSHKTGVSKSRRVVSA